MKNKIIPVILLLSILSILFASAVSAQSVSPGVAKGDEFDYSYTVTWNSTDPSLAVPNDIVKLNQTQGFEIIITGVSGTTVNAEVTRIYRDGTTSVVTGLVDVQSGSINLPYGSLIVPSGLNVNDKIYPSLDMTINNTVTRSYPSGNRQTNEFLTETTSATHSDKTDIYFDKIKGIGVLYYYESIDTYGSETEIYTETMTNTNSAVWAVAPSATPTPTTTSSGANPALTPTPIATATSQTTSPSVTEPNPTSNNDGTTDSTSQPATGTPQPPINPIIIIVVVIIVVAVAIGTVALRRKKKPISESEEIIKNLKK
jgi:hypothetical protein